MHPSANTPAEGLPPPPISSLAIAGGRSNTTAHHHVNGPESSNNCRVVESKPSSSSSSPPKSPSPNNGNSIPAAAQGHDSRGCENPSQSGETFLQWGQRKRSKRSVGDKFSGVRTMAPPAPPAGKGGSKLRTSSNGVFSSKDSSSSSLRNRSLEESSSTRMGGGSGGGSPPSKNQDAGSRPISSRSTLGKRSDKSDAKRKETTEQVAEADKAGAEVVEWPRIFIALSRKEKEDDFFSIKGTKLPHRPKKRAKAIDRTLQYCFPGMWLSDLSRARYEVRERKSVKKQQRRRGLKGLDNMESDSE